MNTTTTPMHRWPTSWEALGVLAESPFGTTGPRLVEMGFPLVTLKLLVADGFASMEVRHFAVPKGAAVEHFSITKAGRFALREHRS